MKTIYISFGPTGVGKSAIFNLFNLNSKNSVDCLVDDLVMKSLYYNKKVKSYIQNNFINQLNKLQIPLNKSNYNKRSLLFIKKRETIDKLNTFYFDARKKHNCDNNLNIVSNKSNTSKKPYSKIRNCDKINDTKLENAIHSTKKHIVLESTGEYFPEWLFNEQDFPNIKKFKIVLIWFVAPIKDLIDRNINRSIKMMLKYIYYDEKSKCYKINESNQPPRLPEINKRIYKEKLSRIIKTFNNKEAIINKLKNEGYHIDVKIFNNPNKKSHIKFIKNNKKTMSNYYLKKVTKKVNKKVTKK